MKDVRQVIWRPVVTEKSTIEREARNVVTFAVDPHAGKIEIKRAVEELFNVKVIDVRTSRVRGKMKRVGRTHGYRPSWRMKNAINRVDAT